MSHQTNYQKNQNGLKALPDYIWKFYAYNGLAGLAFGLYIPIWLLFLLDRGFSMVAIGVFSGVMVFSMFALEVPTGIIADKFSRKWSVCFGLIFQGICMLVFVTTTNYFLILGGFIFFALGGTLRSGADSALLYDSMKSDGREEAFHKTIGNGISLLFIGAVLGNLLCGVIVRYSGLSEPYWAAFIIYLLAATLPAMIKEPPLLEEARTKDKTLTFKDQVSSYLKHVKESFQFIGASSQLIFLIFINLVINRIYQQLHSYFSQPYLKSFAYSAEQISYFFAIFFVISALFAKYSDTVKKYLGDKERRTFLLIVLFGVVSLFSLINAPIGLIAVLAFIGLNLMLGLFLPFIQDSLNRRVPSDKRASCLSIASSGPALIGIISNPLFGYFVDVFSLKTSLIIFQWTFFSLLIIGVFWGWKTLGGVSEPEPITE